MIQLQPGMGIATAARHSTLSSIGAILLTRKTDLSVMPSNCGREQGKAVPQVTARAKARAPGILGDELQHGGVGDLGGGSGHPRVPLRLRLQVFSRYCHLPQQKRKRSLCWCWGCKSAS